MNKPNTQTGGATPLSGRNVADSQKTYADGSKREGMTYDEFTSAPNPRSLIPGTARTTKRTGSGVGDHIFFEAYFYNEDPAPTSGIAVEVFNQPTPQEISIVQKNLSYHPAGYGRNKETATLLEDGRWHVIWSCSASCD